MKKIALGTLAALSEGPEGYNWSELKGGKRWYGGRQNGARGGPGPKSLIGEQVGIRVRCCGRAHTERPLEHPTLGPRGDPGSHSKMAVPQECSGCPPKTPASLLFY